MNRERLVTLYFLLFVLGALIILWLTGCSAYKKVAGNASPTEKERSLLAVACEREFPPIISQFTIDSTIKVVKQNYSRQIDSLINETEKLDSIIHEQIPVIDTSFVDSSNCLPRIKIAYEQIERLTVQRGRLQVSINRLKNQLFELREGYIPCEERIIYRDRTTNLCDSARMQKLHDRANNAEKRNIVLETQLFGKAKQSQNRLLIIFGLAGLIGVGIFLKLKKVI